MNTEVTLRPVTEQEQERCGLMPHWKFFHAPPGLFCWLCKHPAAYVSESLAFCTHHAQDF